MSPDWKSCSLTDLYEIRSGLSKPRSEFGYGHGFLTFKDVMDNYFVPDSLGSLVNSTEKEREGCSIKRGDVFFTRTSETQEDLGLSSVALRDYPEATFNGFTKRLRPKHSTEIVPEYAGYYFRSPKFRRDVTAMSSLSTRASLNNEMIERLTITIPPVEIQQAIGSILKALDDKIELNRRMNETLESLARAIFKSWFVDFDPVRAKMDGRQPTGMDEATAALFPDELVHVDGELIPKGWKSGRIDDLFVLQRGFDLPSKERKPGCFPVIAAGGIHGTHFEAKVAGPGVVTGRSGVLGKVYFISEDFWPLNTTLWVKEYRGSLPIHAYHFLQTLKLEGFNAGSAVPTLNRNHVHCLHAAIPDIRVIERFETFAAPIFETMRKAVWQSETLATLRDTLLPKLLSGELRVGDAMQLVDDTMSVPSSEPVGAEE